MSRHTSPGPSHPHSQPQNFHPGPTPPSRQKTKPYSIGIAAGAEDVKYQAKYKDLKRKVKEIEADNDKLHFKVLQAKRSIQRMKLERAVLYERLSVVPPSPDAHDHHALPPIHPVPGIPPHQSSSHSIPGHHQPREIRDHSSANEPEPGLVEYFRTQGNPRVVPGLDGRPVPVMDTPMGPGIAPSSHGLSAIHSSRHSSGASGHDSSRQLPPLPHLSTVQHLEARGHNHSHVHSSPHMHHVHASSSHEHSRSHSSSRSRAHQVPTQSYHPHPQQYPESFPQVQHVLHSPPLSERERSRRHDIHELVNSHGDPHGHSRHHTPLAPHSPRTHTVDARSSGRTHQHMAPVYISRDDRHEREREPEREREREWDRGRDPGIGREIPSAHMHSPPSVHRSRQPTERIDYQEHHLSSRMREEQGYYHDVSGLGGYTMLSRSGTPGSGSGSGSGMGAGDGPSRPDSRTQFYDDRPRSYRLRPVTQPNEDTDFVREDGRSQSRDRGAGGGGGVFPSEQSRTSLESRKRSRNDMEIDAENEAAESAAGVERILYAGHIPEDRGSKRYHREHLGRGVDQEDDRMGS